MAGKNSVHLFESSSNKDENEIIGEILSLNFVDIPKKSNISIKVNLCDYQNNRGIITHPKLLQALIHNLEEKQCHVTIVESNGLLYSATEAYHKTGMAQHVKITTAKFVNLTHDILVPLGKRYHWVRRKNQISIPRALAECDYFITMPMMKTHEITLFTGALKNQFGCYWQHNRILLHHRLSEAIVNINKLLRPDLCIMDGRVAIEGNGPARGYPVNMNLVLAANNPLSCDLVALKLMGFKDHEISHVQQAKINMTGTDYQLNGKNADDYVRVFKRPVNDLPNKCQTYISSKYPLSKIFFDSKLNRYIVSSGRFVRKHVSLKNRTEYF